MFDQTSTEVSHPGADLVTDRAEQRLSAEHQFEMRAHQAACVLVILEGVQRIVRGVDGEAHLRTRTGMRIETTRQVFAQVEDTVREIEHLNTEIGILERAANDITANGGTSIMVHAKADDMKTDPTGNAGNRIACGIIMSNP